MKLIANFIKNFIGTIKDSFIWLFELILMTLIGLMPTILYLILTTTKVINDTPEKSLLVMIITPIWVIALGKTIDAL